MDAVSAWVQRIRSGERLAISRALTAVENDAEHALNAALAPHGGRAQVVGVTGPPGAG